MPPKPDAKPKKKKKTKEELEAERLAAEEAERLAEAERLRAEEEERQRLAELEARRQALLAEYYQQEHEWLEAEHMELEPIFGQYALQRGQAAETQSAAREWERFLACVHVPLPTDSVLIETFLNEQAAAQDTQLVEAFDACQDCHLLIKEAEQLAVEANQGGADDVAAQLYERITSFQSCCTTRIDRVTAHILAHADEHANDKHEVQLGVVHGPFHWALWVNTSKNPRMKQVDLPQISMVVDIPKQIALANIALRVQRRTTDEFFTRCTNQYMAMGGVLYADLLAIPPSAKKVRGWTLRQVTPLSHNVQRIPYPIPPAGADPATYRAEEEPPPLGFTYALSPHLVVVDEPPVVGWWSSEEQGWSLHGISDVSYDVSTFKLSFKTTHLAPLALITPRCRLLPYSAWNIRPTGGRNGSTAALSLEVGLTEPLVFEVGPESVTLASPQWPQLEGLVGVPQSAGPLHLLLELSRRGLHLLPADRDAQWADVTAKDRSVEAAFCVDLSMLGGVFLMASSKWNQSTPYDECLVRISEVLDWEGGGRTEPRHVARIFDKEKEDGERRVLVLVQRGLKGVAFSDALNRREEYVGLPPVGSVEEVESMKGSIWGEVHASALALLRGHFHVPNAAESSLALRLCAAQESLELCRNTNPLFTQMLADLMFALRLFSFS